MLNYVNNGIFGIIFFPLVVFSPQFQSNLPFLDSYFLKVLNTESLLELQEKPQLDKVHLKLIQKKLFQLYSKEIKEGLVDEYSRQFKCSQVDFNNDGTKEFLIGQTGSYFCGSGGCTVLLLNDKGDLITKFSVVKYPAYVDIESTNGWQNLILFSGGKNRVAKFDGNTYPSNPSTLNIFLGKVDEMTKVLDWEELEIFKF